jgi:hypothetical protein
MKLVLDVCSPSPVSRNGFSPSLMQLSKILSDLRRVNCYNLFRGRIADSDFDNEWTAPSSHQVDKIRF